VPRHLEARAEFGERLPLLRVEAASSMRRLRSAGALKTMSVSTIGATGMIASKQ